MEPPGGRDSRFNLGYNMNLLSGETAPEIYGNPSLGRPSTSIQQLSPRHTMVSSACSGRTLKNTDICYDDRGMASQNMGLDACGVNDLNEDYGSLQPKKSPPSNGKKTKGRVKIKMEYIENKLRRYTTFSKRKTGIMKKAYELSTLTGTQVMLLVASETGHVYTFATRKLQPMITSEAGKALIQTCLNSPDPPAGSASGDQRMSATGFEETELTYNISDEDSKDENMSEADTSGSSEGEGEDYAPDVVFVPPDSNSKSSRSTSPLKSSDSIINNSTSAPSILTSSILSSSSPPPSSSSSSSSSLLSSSSASSTTTTTTATAAAATTKTTTTTTTTTTIMPTSISKLTNSQTFTSTTTPPIISPLVYQTAQGMMYAAPTNGGVIFSLGQTDSGTSHPQFITIPLSMVTANNGQGELDLTKRK